MEYTFLGKSGLKVTNVCLGTMTFGVPKPGSPAMPYNLIQESVCYEILDKYLELGGNFIDTADIYQTGLSEEIVGKWMANKQRDHFVIATKVFFPMDMANVNRIGLSRRNITEGCEASLERLQTPYIDLYQTHCWDPATPIDETLRTLDDLIRAGKTRYFGLSNVCGWQMQQIVDKIDAMGLNKCISLQQQYSLLERHSEREEFMVCRDNGIGVLPWSPLKGGLLTGKYTRDKKPDVASGRVGIVHQDETKKVGPAPGWSDYVHDERYWALRDQLSGIANTHDKSVAQVALRWLLQKDIVASVIIGATSAKQVEENCVVSTGWKLSDDEMEALDSVSRPKDQYPFDFIYGHPFAADRKNYYNKSYFP